MAELQTFLIAKRPSAAMSEKKRPPFAGYTEISTKAFHSQASAAHGKYSFSLIWENYSKHIYITNANLYFFLNFFFQIDYILYKYID